MEAKLPKLRYQPAALEPIISSKTIDFHFNKHLNGYINNLIKLSKGTTFEGLPVEEIVKKAPEGGLLNNAGQVINHVYYFNQFTENPTQDGPKGKLLTTINEQYGSFENMKEKLSTAAKTLFGSGWVWLTINPGGKLEIIKAPNGENPLREGHQLVFTIDVWEHAYYLDYQNRRPDYVDALWQLIDWEVVEKRIE